LHAGIRLFGRILTMQRSPMSPLFAFPALQARYPGEPATPGAMPVDSDEARELRGSGLHRRGTHLHDDRPAGRMTLLPHS